MTGSGFLLAPPASISSHERHRTSDDAESKTSAPTAQQVKRGSKARSRHISGIPSRVVKRLSTACVRSSGIRGAKIDQDTLNAIMLASQWFFEQSADDLRAFAEHAGRKTVDLMDVTTLMRR